MLESSVTRSIGRPMAIGHLERQVLGSSFANGLGRLILFSRKASHSYLVLHCSTIFDTSFMSS